MKVIHISNYYAEFKGSFISQIELLGEEIKNNGGEIIYIFPDKAINIQWCKELKKNFKVYFVSCINRTNEKKVTRELKEIMNTEKPNIVHTHFDGYDVAATKAAQKHVVKIYHRHNEFDIDKLSWYKKIYASINIRIRMIYLKNKGYNIFTSKEMYYKFINKGYSIKDKSKIIINGIATKRLDKEINNYKKYEKPVIFSFVGNWERKGGDILFKAIEQVNSKDINVYLASIISKEFIKDKFGYIPEWLIDLQITDSIKKYYDLADIFVSSSRKETFSYALAEAIYCGLPCISSDIDGVQWAKEIPSVSFFENEDVDSLAKQINKVLNEEYSDIIYKQSRDYILNNYSEYIWSKNIFKLYTQYKNSI